MLIYYGVTAVEHANEVPLLREEFDTLEFYDSGASWIWILVALLLVGGSIVYYYVYRNAKAQQQQDQERAEVLKTAMTEAVSNLPSKEFETKAIKLWKDYTSQMERFPQKDLQDQLSDHLKNTIESRRSTIKSAV